MKAARYEKIITALSESRYVSIKDLHEKTGIPVSTLRNDLGNMSGRGIIKRLRGGAALIEETNRPSIMEEDPFSERNLSNAEEKTRIARKAMEMIHPNDTVILDSGTTTYELAKLFRDYEHPLMVATNNLPGSMLMADNKELTVVVLGGMIRTSHYSIVGPFVSLILQQMRADIAFLATDAVDLELGLMTYYPEKAGVKQKMCDVSKKKVLLCDHTKFKGTAFVQSLKLKNIDCIITGHEIDEGIAEQIRKKKIELLVV